MGPLDGSFTHFSLVFHIETSHLIFLCKSNDWFLCRMQHWAEPIKLATQISTKKTFERISFNERSSREFLPVKNKAILEKNTFRQEQIRHYRIIKLISLKLNGNVWNISCRWEKFEDWLYLKILSIFKYFRHNLQTLFVRHQSLSQ